MTTQELRKIFSEYCNDIVFSYAGKPSGVTIEVSNYAPMFQVWHGDQTKVYDDLDDLMSDPFYSGKSLDDLAEKVEFDIL